MEIARIKVFSNKAVVESRGVIVAGTVGATVGVEFDAQWLDMDSRTLVWRAGSVIKDDTACTGTVPQEVLGERGQELFLGVYGTKGSTATPTLWACLGHIHAGADPSGDESTDPSLPVWAQADQKVSLAQKAAQEAAASAAVKETFVAVYGQTSFGEVKEAYGAGKACFCDDGGTLAALALVTDAKLYFSAWVGKGIMAVYTLTAEDVWETDSDARYKTTQLTSGSTHSQVPTAKTVYDALAQITDEVFVGRVSQITYDNLSRVVGEGRYKLVCVVDDTVNATPLYIRYGSGEGLRFYRVNEAGIHWISLDSSGTWSRGSQKLDAAVEEALTAAKESGAFDGADGQDGEDGKSAYAFAQEGGYAGTEAEFAEKLAQEPELFLITIANKPGGGTADKTYAEILAAYQAGKLVVLKYGNYLHFLVSYGPTGITFYPAVTSVGVSSANRKWTVTSADVWSYADAGIPFATTTVTGSSTDSQLPTARAVWDAIEAKHPKYELIQSVEVTEPVQKIEFSDLNLDEFTLFMQAPLVESSVSHDMRVYNTDGTNVFYHWPGGTIYTDYPRNCCWHVNRKKGYVEGFYSVQTVASNDHVLAPKPSQMTHSYVDGSLPFDRIKLDTYYSDVLFPVGLKIEIWGVKADG